MFLDSICKNIDILVVINIHKNNFGFHSNQNTQGQKHQVNNLNFKYQVGQMKLRHLIRFLQNEVTLKFFCFDRMSNTGVRNPFKKFQKIEKKDKYRQFFRHSLAWLGQPRKLKLLLKTDKTCGQGRPVKKILFFLLF